MRSSVHQVSRWLVLVLAALAGAILSAPAAAGAATYCVGVRADGCSARDTAAEAFAAARADEARDTILLGRLTADGSFADAAGRPVRVIGLGSDVTRLRGSGSAAALRLHDPGSSARALRVDAGGGAGAPAVQVDDGAALQSAVVNGRVLVRGGTAGLSSVAVLGAGPAVEAACDASSVRLALTGVSMLGAGDAGVAAGCATAGRSVAVTVADSVVWGFERGFAIGGGASLAASGSVYRGASGEGNRDIDPRFAAPGDPQPAPGSPLVDAGRSGALGEDEPHEDALGFVRAVDGDGSGGPRRDIGAVELQPPAPPGAPGNVLANPGAEAGTPADDDRASPAPPQWTRTGAFTFVRYGTVAGQFPFPSRRVGEALGAGSAFFAAGPGKDGTATQMVDLSHAAPEIDLRQGAATLSALLGGYRSSADGAVVEAAYRDAFGAQLGTLRIGPVDAAARAGATTLLPRAAAGAIPPLTRSVAVTLRGTGSAGGYDDAYFDAVALSPRAAGGPLHREPQPAAGRRLRPFPGVAPTARRTAVELAPPRVDDPGVPDGGGAHLQRRGHAHRAARLRGPAAADRQPRLHAAPRARHAALGRDQARGPARAGRPPPAARSHAPGRARRPGPHEDHDGGRPDRPRKAVLGRLGLEPGRWQRAGREPARVVREPAPRDLPARPRVDPRCEVLEREQQPQRRPDLQVGRVGSRLRCAHRTMLDPAVGAVEVEVQVDEVGPHGRVGGAVEVARRAGDERSGQARRRARNGQLRVGAVVHDRAGAPRQRRPHDPPHERLQHLVAQRSACSTSRRSRPSAGSNGGSGARRSSARTISREPSTFSPSSNTTPGTVGRPKRRRCCSFATTGIMSTRSKSTPFSRSAASMAAHGCEAGRA